LLLASYQAGMKLVGIFLGWSVLALLVSRRGAETQRGGVWGPRRFLVIYRTSVIAPTRIAMAPAPGPDVAFPMSGLIGMVDRPGFWTIGGEQAAERIVDEGAGLSALVDREKVTQGIVGVVGYVAEEVGAFHQALQAAQGIAGGATDDGSGTGGGGLVADALE
jgi:hypothetical protein